MSKASGEWTLATSHSPLNTVVLLDRSPTNEVVGIRFAG